MRHTKMNLRGLALFAVGVVVILLDQYTKYLVRLYLPLNRSWNPIPWLEPIVTLTHVQNTGAAFGLFPNMSAFFAIVALVVVAAIVIYYRQLSTGSWLLSLAFGLQFGGATGNLIDRLRFGYVIDFVDFRVWPVFNVADSALVVGTALLAYYALALDRKEEKSALPQVPEASVEDRGTEHEL